MNPTHETPTRIARPLIRLALLALIVLGLAQPAQSQVSYVGTISGGFGDGGDPPVVDPGQNGLPVCVRGPVHRSHLTPALQLAPATNATIPVGP